MITDIALAPRNARGNVEYRHNFYILKPVDPSKGNHQVMYEPPNRGGKTFSSLNRTSGNSNDPAAITDAAMLANSFLWARGYTTVWSGWENAPRQPRRHSGDEYGDGGPADTAQSGRELDYRTAYDIVTGGNSFGSTTLLHRSTRRAPS